MLRQLQIGTWRECRQGSCNRPQVVESGACLSDKSDMKELASSFSKLGRKSGSQDSRRSRRRRVFTRTARSSISISLNIQAFPPVLRITCKTVLTRRPASTRVSRLRPIRPQFARVPAAAPTPAGAVRHIQAWSAIRELSVNFLDRVHDQGSAPTRPSPSPLFRDRSGPGNNVFTGRSLMSLAS